MPHHRAFLLVSHHLTTMQCLGVPELGAPLPCRFRTTAHWIHTESRTFTMLPYPPLSWDRLLYKRREARGFKPSGTQAEEE